MWYIFASRLLLSIADAAFWVLIIFGIGITFIVCFKWVMDYLMEEVEIKKGEEED